MCVSPLILIGLLEERRAASLSLIELLAKA